MFYIFSHLFFKFDFGLSRFSTVCAQRLYFSSAFPKQEHPCLDLKLLVQAFRSSIGQEATVRGNTWKKAFQVNTHQKVLHFYARDGIIFPF